MAAIIAFTVLFALAGPASATTTQNPGTAVAAQTHVDHTAVGLEASVSPTLIGANSSAGYDSMSGCCVAPTSAADDLVRFGGDVSALVWVSRTADNGKGTVWQCSGAGDAETMLVMDPTDLYPNGYARFYNDSGQPLTIAGKPGSHADTHIPLQTDGTLQVPDGWR